MSDYTLTVPDDVYQRAVQHAQRTNQPVEAVLQTFLRRASETLPQLSTEEEMELAALQYLSDDALRSIASAQMPPADQQHMQSLMAKNSAGTLSDDEQVTLQALVERGQRLLLRKSEAAVLLIQRGYDDVALDDATSE